MLNITTMREAMRVRDGQPAEAAHRAADERAGAGASRLIEAITRHARQRPDSEAVAEVGAAGARCTYGTLAGIIEARARSLRERVDPQGVVVAVVPSGIEYAAWFCASIAAGVRFLPMHTQIAGPEARAVAERAGAVALIGGEGLGLEPGRERVDGDTASAASQRRRTGGGAAPSTPVADDRPAGAVVLGSSGTTGLPKLALRTSASLDADAAGIIAGMGLTSNDRIVVATPLTHSYGVDLLVGALTAGASMRVVAQFDAEVVAHELTSGASVLPGVPFIFEALARCHGRRSGSLRLALSAGSPLPGRVREGFSSAWGVEVGQLYGATELGTVSMDMPGTPGFDASSVGRPLAGVSMRVVDVEDSSRTLRTGEEGQLAVRAESMLSAYLDGEVPLADGHLLTGDLARIDADGRVRITGRLKMLIDIGAYKVNPLEVEGVLATHPDVVECVVVPVAASETLQRLRAVVVVRDAGRPRIADTLRQYLRERLAPVKVPRVVDIVDSMPRSPTGKILRNRV